MAAIHLVKNDPKLPDIRPVEPGSDVWKSGNWVVAEEKANALIGGKIYFHEARAKPSFFGGEVLGFEHIQEGEWAGRVIFTFRFEPSCKGVTTSRDGWGQEMKLDL